MKTILVTGGTGFLGLYLYTHLICEEPNILCFDYNSKNKVFNFNDIVSYRSFILNKFDSPEVFHV